MRLRRAAVAAVVGAAWAVGSVAAAPAQAPDETAPVITRRVLGLVGEGGWYRSPVNVSWTVRDPESAYITSGCDARTLTAETSGMRVECRAESAGGTSVDGQVIRIDATPPTVTRASPERDPDRGGWFNRLVRVGFAGEDAVSGVASCTETTYAGPDTPTAKVSGTCRDRAGNPSAPFEHFLRYDATAPELNGVRPWRAPDHWPFYNRPVEVDFDAADATSGVAGCPTVLFEGPEDAEINGRCVDYAGNEAARTFAIPYDVTPPLVDLRARVGATHVALRWSSPDAVTATLVRWGIRQGPGTARVIYRGTRSSFMDRSVREGRRYRYAVAVLDRAGLEGRAERPARPRRRLLAPTHRARLTAPPHLRWTPIAGTRYYNVKLYRRGRLVLSAWPRRAELALPATWRSGGRTRRLRAGGYRWYVWPLPRRARRFAPRIGTRTFIIVRPPA